MATLVRHFESKQTYILLGVGFGMFSSSRPGMLLGDILPKEAKGDARLVAATDTTGTIKWFHAKDLEVIEVDGKSLHELLER